MNKHILKIHLCPNAKKNNICGIYNNEYLKISISSPPVDGKANEELIKFLARKLNIPKSDIKITKGQTTRNKIIEINTDNNIEKNLNEIWCTQEDSNP